SPVHRRTAPWYRGCAPSRAASVPSFREPPRGRLERSSGAMGSQDMAADIALWTVAALLVVGGLAGLVLPALPGAPLMFAGFLLAAWIEDFAYVGAGTLTALGVLAALTFVVDFVAGALGARRYGA